MGIDRIPVIVREVVQGLIAGDSEESDALLWEEFGGGPINPTYRIRVSENARKPSLESRNHDPNQWFCKINTVEDFPEMFEKEVRGLELLNLRGGMRVPQVRGHVIAGEYQVLVLEWIGQQQGGQEQDGQEQRAPEQGSHLSSLRGSVRAFGTGADAAFWTSFGEKLARMHQVTHPFFGLEEDNYMGALPQSNARSDSWTEFFTRERLEPQVRMAFDKTLLDRSHLAAFGRLYNRLPAIFPEEPAVLVHGDLWSGNFLRGPRNHPVLIDPAVYYGHRSMDLAMTTLFGGFDRRFYESYQDQLPFPANYVEQWTVCNLYPLLIHLNLFGRGYLADVIESLEKFS